MTFSELQAAFEDYTGVVGEIDDAELAIWFNEAQLDLALDFGPIKNVALTPNSNGIAALPPDCIKLLDAASDYVWTAGGSLVFNTTNDVNITYRAMPDPIHVFTGANPDQTPDLPYMLHYLLAVYATSLYWYRESEGDAEEMTLAREWMSRYQMAKKNFLGKMNVAGDYIDRWIVEEY